MCWSRRLPAALLLLATLARAQPGTAVPGDDLDWMLVLSAQTDADSYRGVLGGVYLGLADATWLSLTLGSSEAPETERDIRADLAIIGIEHDFGPIGLGLVAESWGDSDKLETRDWRGELFFGDDRYRFTLAYERKDIDIFFAGSPLVSDLRRANLEASGLGISGRLRLSPDWRIYGSWMEYDFPERVRLVPRADRLNLLSASTVTLAYSLEDYYASFGVERAFASTLLNIDLGRDRSAIDGARLTSLSGTVLWPVARRVDLEFTLGRSRTEGYGASVYGGLSILFYGG